MEFIKLLEILKTGESGNVEFKRNDNADLRKDICAFANSRDGGVILLGVDDDGNPVGVEGGVARALIIDMPEINGVGATYTISVLDEEDSVVFVSEAQNEDAVSLVALTVPFMIMPTDKIKITPSALPSNVDCSVKIR